MVPNLATVWPGPGDQPRKAPYDALSLYTYCTSTLKPSSSSLRVADDTPMPKRLGTVTCSPISTLRVGALKEVLGTRLRYASITGFQMRRPASPLPEPWRATPVDGTR